MTARIVRYTTDSHFEAARIAARYNLGDPFGTPESPTHSYAAWFGYGRWFVKRHRKDGQSESSPLPPTEG